MTPIDDRAAALAYVDEHIGYGIRPGLERMEAILGLMGDPHTAYPIIHVAGTNGKTSTTHIAASILTGHGLRVGSTTSPHLQHIEERFALDGEPATPEGFTQAVADVAPFVEMFRERSGDHPTYFELTTLIAFSYFATQSVDVAVVETGLGGRLDATNVAHGKVAVLTGVALEHTQYLGDTLAAIAGEKVAIAKPGSTLVTGELPDEAADVIAEHVENLELPHRRMGHDFGPVEPRLAVGGWVTDLRGVHETYHDLFIPLHGRHQVDNAAVAVAAVEELFGRALSREGLRSGLASVAVPGRVEVVARQPLVVLDGAHNPDGLGRLVTTLRDEFGDVAWTVVMGAMADKDVEAMISELDGLAVRLVVTQVADSRAVPAEDLADLARRLLGVPVTARAEPRAAVDDAVGSTLDDGAVLVTGSLYLVGAVRGAFAR